MWMQTCELPDAWPDICKKKNCQQLSEMIKDESVWYIPRTLFECVLTVRYCREVEQFEIDICVSTIQCIQFFISTPMTLYSSLLTLQLTVLHKLCERLELKEIVEEIFHPHLVGTFFYLNSSRHFFPFHSKATMFKC